MGGVFFFFFQTPNHVPISPANNNNNWPKANALRSDQFPELGSEPAAPATPIATPPTAVQATNIQTYQQQRDAFPSLKAVNGPAVPPPPKKPVAPKAPDLVETTTVLEPVVAVVMSNCVGAKARARSRAPVAARPAVIILNEAPPPDLHLNNSEPIQVSGLTFGFEVNEQLLNNCNSSGDETLLMEEEAASLLLVEEEEEDAATGPAKTAGELFIAKFVAPPVPDVKDCYNHDRIVTFVGLGECACCTVLLGA